MFGNPHTIRGRRALPSWADGFDLARHEFAATSSRTYSLAFLPYHHHHTQVTHANMTTTLEPVAPIDPAAAPVAPVPIEPDVVVPTEPTPTATASAPEPEPVSKAIDPTLPAPASTSVPAPPEPRLAPTEPADEEEPQNALTKKFTEAEWAALKDFRTHLPEVFKQAYKEKENYAPAPIDIWGVTIDPSGKKDAKASVVLMKWLRARDLNVETAKSMMVATLRWREEFGVEAAVKEEFSKDVFGDLGHIYGKDKEGRPVTYNLYGRMADVKTVFGDKQRFMRWRIKLMEEGIKLLDYENVDQMVQVHDYEGVGWNSRDANSKAAASEISNIFSNHYPEFLARKFFVNVPTAFTWIFWLFKPLLPQATLAKMKVAGSGPHAIGKELLPVIDAKQLPQRYGGDVVNPF
ncbi:CRAL-TRIO domain-containing protein [Amylostereum chailletii]|nr:CRAL-TRIO domain-containing protein [Amylostereum chailletii]